MDADVIKNWDEYISWMGRPFRITLSITADTTDNEFILASTDFDWNGDGTDDTNPFANWVLVIVGMDIQIGSGTYTARVLVDGKMIYTETTSASAVSVHWDNTIDATNDVRYPALKDIFGQHLVCRDRIKVTKSAGPGGATTLTATGFAIPKQF